MVYVHQDIQMLTFDFEVRLAGEVVALSDDAGVAPHVRHLGVLDDEREHVIVDDERVLGALVAFLDTEQKGECKKGSWQGDMLGLGSSV